MGEYANLEKPVGNILRVNIIDSHVKRLLRWYSKLSVKQSYVGSNPASPTNNCQINNKITYWCVGVDG